MKTQTILLTMSLIASSLNVHGAQSHPPIRPLPAPAQRPMDKGPSRFVDETRGKDSNDGSEKSPWKTINHAMPLLNPGDTLYLRAGIDHVCIGSDYSSGSMPEGVETAETLLNLTAELVRRGVQRCRNYENLGRKLCANPPRNLAKLSNSN